MDDEPGSPCSCDICNGAHKSKPRDVPSIPRTSARTVPPQRPVSSVSGAPRGRPSRGRGRPSSLRGRLPTYQGPRDDDSLPDFVTRWLTLLKREGHIERDLREIPSLEHQLENTILGETAKRLGKYPSFAPRVGELVLFYRNYDGELKRDPQNGHVKIYDTRTQLFKGYPKWLGGIVTQIPVDDEPILLEDIEGKARKNLGVSSSGFRVECLPDINSEDKSLTKQYTHVPLMHIRPMIYWQDYIPNEQRLKEAHSSVSNVLAANRTISLIGKYKLFGMWPDAHIFAKGLFLGSECHYAGDVVRLFPEDDDGEKVTKVMEIHAFILSMINLEAEPYDGTTVTGDRCDHITIKARGKVYQREPPDSSAQPIDPSMLPEIMHPFSPWYYPPSTTSTSSAASSNEEYHSIEAVRILSRLPSFPSTQIYSSPSTIHPTAALSKGYRSVCDARIYSLHHDARLDSPGAKKEEDDLDAGASSRREGSQGGGRTWFLAETRAEALDIESFNGIEVGTLQDRNRDLARMQRIYEVLKEAKENDNPPIRENPRSISTPSNVGIAPMVIPPSSSSTMTRAVGMPSVVIDKGKGKAIDLLTSDEDEEPQQEGDGDDSDDDDDSDDQHPTNSGNELNSDQDIDMLGIPSHPPSAPSTRVKPSGMVLASNTAAVTAAATSSVEVISSDDDDDSKSQDQYANVQALPRAGRMDTSERSTERGIGDMEREAKRMKL